KRPRFRPRRSGDGGIPARALPPSCYFEACVFRTAFLWHRGAMGTTSVLLIIGATVTAVASRALLIHGLPVIEVNDPARPVGTAGGSSNSTSWLGAIALPL